MVQPKGISVNLSTTRRNELDCGQTARHNHAISQKGNRSVFGPRIPTEDRPISQWMAHRGIVTTLRYRINTLAESFAQALRTEMTLFGPVQRNPASIVRQSER